MFPGGLAYTLLIATSFPTSVGDCGSKKDNEGNNNSTLYTDPHHVQVARVAAMRTEQMDPWFLLCITPGPKCYISSGET